MAVWLLVAAVGYCQGPTPCAWMKSNQKTCWLKYGTYPGSTAPVVPCETCELDVNNGMVCQDESYRDYANVTESHWMNTTFTYWVASDDPGSEKVKQDGFINWACWRRKVCDWTTNCYYDGDWKCFESDPIPLYYAKYRACVDES